MSNKQIFREYIERVFNPQNFDLGYDYFSEECIFHTPPYVGLGIQVDDTIGDKVIIQEVTPHGPAAEHLQKGDEVIRVSDEAGIRETFEQISQGTWGQGKIATPITVTVRRGDETFDFTFSRGRIEGFDTHENLLRLSPFYVRALAETVEAQSGEVPLSRKAEPPRV